MYKAFFEKSHHVRHKRVYTKEKGYMQCLHFEIDSSKARKSIYK